MPRAGSVITIGNFDGVHAGHAGLLRRARDLAADAGARVVAFYLDPHPISILRPGAEPARLTTAPRREALLREAGADEVYRLDPSQGLLSLSPEEFIARLVAEHRPVAMVEGPDFRFGKARAGDLATLRTLGERHGFALHAQPALEVALTDHTIVRASSTIARWLLAHGRAADAGLVLGRPHILEGRVVRGDQRGRVLGFPTANLAPDVALPADGVYACLAHLPDTRTFPAALSVGVKPTMNGAARTAEAHILGSPGLPLGDDATGYGWPLRLDVVAWVREQVRFPSIDALRGQIDRDCRRVTDLLATHDALDRATPPPATATATAGAARP